MGGIVGILHYDQNMELQRQVLEKMTAHLLKRGPDAQKVWVEHHIALGSTRLAVIDPEGAKQPMCLQIGDSLFTLVFNGEIYNADELRKELQAEGVYFQTGSDTEVLLQAYVAWQEECIEKLKGMFAFALWDGRKQQLFLVRDRLGVKPLFYSKQGDLFLFGSEMKAILAHPKMKAKLTCEGLCEIFGLGPARTPGHGVFTGIFEVKPAHYLLINKHGVKVKKYWQLEYQEHRDSMVDTVDKVRSLFIAAVRRQLKADVPLSTLLSGGVDSSAITAITALAFHDRQEELHTFSLDYADNEQYFAANEYQPNTDGPYIDQVSKLYQTSHHPLVIQIEELVELLTEAVILRDLPGMADIDASLLWFCRQIKPQATVVLSGEGADEIFGGYPWFHRPELLNSSLFPWMQSLAEREGLLLSHWQKKLAIQEYVQSRYQETLAEVPIYEGNNSQEKQLCQLAYLNMVWFMATLIERKDRMSMGAGIEARLPFADHQLVEYVWNIPWELKNYGRREKGLLRKALEGLLPADVLYRKKSPFPKTFHPAYTNYVKEWLSSVINNPASPLLELVDKVKVEQLIATDGSSFTRPWFGQLMRGPQLIAHLAQINFWLTTYNVDLEV